MPQSFHPQLSIIADDLVRELKPLRFSTPIVYVYNPLIYARESYECYIQRYGSVRRKVLLLGMNPGPWGMAQTGIPFGDVTMVRDWLGIDTPVGKPPREHPKRPILGFACPRSEVSGTRLWGWAKHTFRTPAKFFKRFFIANYCPLCFMEESGRNFTPDKLPVSEKKTLLSICDRALCRTVETMQPAIVIGIGAFAERRAVEALEGFDIKIGRAPHPSPANPLANRNWNKSFEKALRDCGVEV